MRRRGTAVRRPQRLEWAAASAAECRERIAESVDFLISVVVVRGGADERRDATLIHIEAGPGCIAHRDIDPLLREGRLDRFRGNSLAYKAHDAAPDAALVAHLHPGNPREPITQLRGEGLHALPDRAEPEFGRITRGRSKPDAGGTVELPVLEAARVATEFKPVGRGPGSCTTVDERWLHLRQRALTHVQEPRAARSTQELAAGGGEKIAPDGGGIDRHLSDGLAGIEQVVATGRAGELADRCGWIH